MFTHTLRDEVYGSHITLATGHRDDLKVLAKEYDPEFDGDMDFLGRCIEGASKEKHQVLVMLPDWPFACHKSPKDISILVHELLHATEFVMWHHDIDHSVETQEAWAYYFDHLVRRALEVLN